MRSGGKCKPSCVAQDGAAARTLVALVSVEDMMVFLSLACVSFCYGQEPEHRYQEDALSVSHANIKVRSTFNAVDSTANAILPQ